MISRTWMARAFLVVAVAVLCFGVAYPREREPNGSYAERRARLRAQVDAPVVIFGFTGKEDASPSYIFGQEESFYYLTGHNEEGAVLVLLPNGGLKPAAPPEKSDSGPKEILFLPPRNKLVERWNGPRLGPDDPGIAEKTGFAVVEPYARLKDELERLAKDYIYFYTLLPGQNEAGYPHRATWSNWLRQNFPMMNLRDVSPPINAMRQIKSPSEMVVLGRAIELSADAHLEAMKMIRPGLFEYEVAARMEYVHKRGGAEREGYAPIVGAGFNSTLLHYNGVRAQIQDGDLVLMDVACEYGGYSADITRTVPANGKFTPRQREIYEIVLAAADAAIAAIKPGVTLGGNTPGSLQKIAYDIIDSRGKDKEGHSLGRYFIHGLGHHIGLNVHDPGVPGRALEPGMVITVEPGIYIPGENLGVRIEDDVLVTETGYKVLSARVPRTVEEIEKLMAEAKKKGN
ncbi:MAG: aminopeptidase P N-terminal domain-containing protein [Acidobacteria bacterium]|nr:aminopeptidase P N-terminal domain-containing protein [Acidobacteriota bacterium]MBI3661885.1 aminopeptidase P N-terminal domain-containing protein [Acidobacteriota bacterium]